MRLRRVSTAIASVAAVGIVLTACAPPEGEVDGDSSSSTSVSASVGPNDFISYNGFTPETYSTYNSAITDRIKASFFYFDAKGEVQPYEELGTAEVLSDDPLTIEFTIADDAVWSDGEPITVADAVLAWGVQNVNIADAEGAPLFNSVSQDLGDTIPAGPEGDFDGKTFTVQYGNPDPDWKIQTYLLDPAHVVAEQAGMSVEELTEAILAKDAAALADAAEFWNTGWMTDPGTVPEESLIPSSGPYKIDSWQAGESVTLVANDEFYGPAPETEQLVIRFVAQDAMVQALDNGDLDVISPQPTVDTLSQLEDLGDKATIYDGDTLTWEHLDFNFMPGAVFSDNLELRKAFAMCVPRQQIVDNLIKPINPNAEVMNAREVFPFQDTYQEVVDASYDGTYDEVDIDAAKAIVEEQVATGTEIRIGYSAPNPRRTEEVAIIKSSCDKAGFNIVDAGNEDFFAPGGTQERGDYEVALFAWAGSGQITSGQNIYATGKPQNYGQYSNPAVDAAWTTLATSMDPTVHLEQTKIIEKLLWDDLFGIPVFAHPSLDASSSDLEGLEHNVTQQGIIWNAEAWQRAE